MRDNWARALRRLIPSHLHNLFSCQYACTARLSLAPDKHVRFVHNSAISASFRRRCFPSTSTKCAAIHVAAELHVVENPFHHPSASAILTSSGGQTLCCGPVASVVATMALSRCPKTLTTTRRRRTMHTTPSLPSRNNALAHAICMHSQMSGGRLGRQTPQTRRGPVCSC